MHDDWPKPTIELPGSMRWWNPGVLGEDFGIVQIKHEGAWEEFRLGTDLYFQYLQYVIKCHEKVDRSDPHNLEMVFKMPDLYFREQRNIGR